MTAEEQTRLMEEMTKLGEERGVEFERWYEAANYPNIKAYCRWGWLLDRIMDGVDS
jgi:hypothetical protein